MSCSFLETPPLDVYAHMALDELLAAQTLRPGAALARFFNWGVNAQPAATFGYAQSGASAGRQIAAAGINEFTRRPTGGGIVLHRDDLTFSLFFTQPSCAMRPADIYAALHGVIKEEFAAKKILLGAYDKAGDYRPAPGGVSADCFTNPVADDLLGQAGEKVLGGAIRRFGNIVLYQGSLQLKGARDNAEYKEILTAAILRYFNAAYAGSTVGNMLLNGAYELAQKVYKTKEWGDKF